MYALRERLGWIWLAVIITAAGLTPSTRREETVWPSRQRQTVFFISGPLWMRAMERRFSGLLIRGCLWVRFIRFTERAWGRERFL